MAFLPISPAVTTACRIMDVWFQIILDSTQLSNVWQGLTVQLSNVWRIYLIAWAYSAHAHGNAKINKPWVQLSTNAWEEVVYKYPCSPTVQLGWLRCVSYTDSQNTPEGIKFQMPTVVTGLITLSTLAWFFFFSHFTSPVPLLVLPGITSQGSHCHLIPYLRVSF